MVEPLLTRAAGREDVERTPFWFMRQAGRSLPEYREIRARRTLFEICRQPELCAEVTLQPVRRHGVDAAIMFADIMLPVLGMGIDVELVDGVGPVVADRVRRRVLMTWGKAGRLLPFAAIPVAALGAAGTMAQITGRAPAFRWRARRRRSRAGR